jgi:hypothetical protein
VSGIRKVSRDHLAIATLRIPDTKAAMPHGHETPCIVHPVTPSEKRTVMDTTFSDVLIEESAVHGQFA